MRFLLSLFALVLAAGPAFAAPTTPRTTLPVARKMPGTAATADDTAGLTYRALGPAISGGRIAAVAGSDRDPFLYYVGAAGGGVFKSTNGGISFSDVFAKQPFASIGAIAVAPSNTNNVWVGTGEANPRNDVSFGDGLWQSTNGGKTWQHRGLAASSNIAKILIDPRNPNIVIVAVLGNVWKDSDERGVYRTADGGKTWTRTLGLGPSSGAADLAWDPKHPDTIYAGMWQFRREPWIFTSGGPAGGLYRSRDNGRTWTKLTNGLPTGLTGRIGIAVAPNHPQRVYAVIQSKEGVIWRSDSGGDTWKLVDKDTLPGQRPFYFSHLRVDPTNDKRVISLSMYLTESKNSGVTFKHLTGELHPDNHDLWWSADGKRIIEGNDGGFILSNDGGATWSFPANINVAQTYHVGYDLRSPYTVCTGLQDNSSWCAPSNTRNGIGVLNRDWYSVAGGDGVWAWPDPIDPSLIWTDTQDGALTIYDTQAHQSIDVSPYPRDAFTSDAGLADNKYRFNWNSPIAFSPANGHVAYFGGNVVFRTEDRGRHWTPISPDLTRNEKVHQRASGGPISLDVSGAEYYDTILDIAPSPIDPGVIWVGTDDGLVQLTRDGGAHWTNVTPAGVPTYGRFEAVEPGRFEQGTAFANMDRHDLGDNAPHVYMTEDFGATWHSIVANLPQNAPVRTVRQDLKNPDVLYVGTETGVWVSLNRGAHWQRLQLNMPTAPVYDLRIHPVANDLIVATHGRGIYILDDLTPIQKLAQARARGSFLFPTRASTLYAQWPSIETGEGGALPNNFFVGKNPPPGAIITFYQRTPGKTHPVVDIVDPNGKVIRHFAGTYDTEKGKKYYVTNVAGVNRLSWDGMEEPPVKWMGTTLPNRGPGDGPEALPGIYSVHVTINGKMIEEPFSLAADPGNPWSLTQLGDRHAFLEALDDEYSQVDVLLNTIDKQMKTATPERRAALLAVRATLTSDARNDEDSIAKPDQLRERIGALSGAIGGSFQPPTQAHLDAAKEIKALFDTTMAKARAVIGSP